MYDIDESESDYSEYEYSDVEYNTLDPYDYQLNDFKNDRKVEDTAEEKLLMCIDNGDLEGVKKILPGLLEIIEDTQVCNGKKEVSEDGDVPSDISEDEKSEDDEEDINLTPFKVKVKEVLLKNGDTPLMAAASSARADLVEYILSLGVNVNHALINSNNCALLSLVSNVCVGWRYINNSWRTEAPKCLKLLIDSGANVKIKGYLTTQESGFTALHYAAQSNYWEMLDLLIQAGADVDAMSNQKETPLMLAATKGYVACCNTLLLAGANADITDRSGSNASYLAGVEGHKILSDAISVYTGSAQHNVELYKIWSQYVHKEDGSDQFNENKIDVIDNISNTCIESFCLALNAPYLVTIMREQGVTISDLKLMNEYRLKEIGVSEEDCDKIIIAMQDLNRKTDNSNTKICFEYGKPIKMVTILEMVGNMSEHIEHLGTNLECWYTHLNKKYQTDVVLHKTTVRKIQSASLKCINRSNSFIEQLQHLKAVCEQKNEINFSTKVNGGNNAIYSNVKGSKISPGISLPLFITLASSIVLVTASIAFIYKKAH